MSLEYRIQASPDYAFLDINLPVDETIKVEASSMASMDTNLHMETKVKGGFGRLLSKEKLFINEYTAKGKSGEISIAPGPSGDIGHYYINEGESFFLTVSSFLACSQNVRQETKWQGLTKSFFSGESFFLIKNSGAGDLWFNCYGGMIEIDIDGEYIVDTGHIVAFTENVDYNVESIGGYKSLFFSGEGFVCRFKGTGKVWIQTKQPFSLVDWADKFRPVNKKNN